METKFIPTDPDKIRDDFKAILKEWQIVTGIELNIGHTYNPHVDVYEEYTTDGYSVYVLDRDGEGAILSDNVYYYEPDNYAIYEAIKEIGGWHDSINITEDLLDDYNVWECLFDELETNYQNYLKNIEDEQN